MFGSSLPSVVCRRAHVLFTLFVFVCVYWCPTHIVFCVCFVFLRLVHPTFPVSMQCTVYPIIVVFVVVTTTDAISGIPQDITTNVVSSNSTPARYPQYNIM